MTYGTLGFYDRASFYGQRAFTLRTKLMGRKLNVKGTPLNGLVGMRLWEGIAT